ncbi:MAG: RHS repeat-associated core domain-containing protein [Bradyrhizobium sp.]
MTKAGYQPYGESGTTAGAFRYTGARIDAETNGLYDFRARIYSPTLGRFLQVDPIGYGSGIHLYAYVNNDPLNLVDPFGNCPQCLIVPAAYYGVTALLAVGAGIVYYGAKAVNETAKILSGTLNNNSTEPTPVYVDPEKYPEAEGHIQDAQNAGAPDRRRHQCSRRRRTIRGQS